MVDEFGRELIDMKPPKSSQKSSSRAASLRQASLRQASLRQEMRKARSQLDQAALEIAANALAKNLLQQAEYQAAEKVAVYFAVNGEIGLQPLIDAALKANKQVYLPNLDQQTLRFSPYFHAQKMRINRYQLPEPDVADSEMIEPEALDLVFAPLVAFDPAGNRIGMGGGFYDRSFAFRKKTLVKTPMLIGVAHQLQLVDQIIPESWDVQLDRVITDHSVYP